MASGRGCKVLFPVHTYARPPECRRPQPTCCVYTGNRVLCQPYGALTSCIRGGSTQAAQHKQRKEFGCSLHVYLLFIFLTELIIARFKAQRGECATQHGSHLAAFQPYTAVNAVTHTAAKINDFSKSKMLHARILARHECIFFVYISSLYEQWLTHLLSRGIARTYFVYAKILYLLMQVPGSQKLHFGLFIPGRGGPCYYFSLLPLNIPPKPTYRVYSRHYNPRRTLSSVPPPSTPPPRLHSRPNPPLCPITS